MLNDWTDPDKATAELQILIEDLSLAGLKTTISPGPEKSFLVLVKAPKNILGREVYKSRYGSLNFCRLWMFLDLTISELRTGCMVSRNINQKVVMAQSVERQKQRTSDLCSIS